MNYILKTPFCILLIIMFNSNFAVSQQVAQFRGINRDGVYDGSNLLNSWPEAGPNLICSNEKVGSGYSAPTVTKNAIFITGKIDSLDYLTALDKTGKQLWRVKYGKAWNGTFPESKCTPTVDNDNVYVVSAVGEVSCFSIKDGKKIWSVEAFKNMGGAYGNWGIAESLLLVDDKVIFTPAGSNTTMVALNKKTGAIVWQTESIKDTADYASPIAIDFAGKKIILQAVMKFAFAVDANDGKLLCKFEFDKGNLRPMNVNTPIFKDDKVLFAAGAGSYSYMLKVAKDLSKFELVWKDTIMDGEYGYVVLKDGYLYGANYINQRKGNWCCIEWETGKLKYETEWETKGTISRAGDMLYCLDEKKGNIALVKANPEKFEIISTFKLPKGTGPCWSNPVIDNGIMYVRRGSVIMAFDIKK